MIEIRQCTIADLPYIYEICWKTGIIGESVETAFTDKFKLGHYFAAPYIHHDLDCCFVATDDGMPKGYVLGTADSRAFAQWMNSDWLPQVRKLYDFKDVESLHSLEQYTDNCMKNGVPMDPIFNEYPAHLHIDILPELQGKGLGRKLMNAFFNKCLEKGATRVHLGVGRKNGKALSFYQRLGMYTIKEEDTAIFLGYDLL